MPYKIENIRVKCPKCLMPHDFRLRIKYNITSLGNIHLMKDTEVLYFKREFYCKGLQEPFEAKVPVYFSRNEQIENVEVKY